MTDEEFAGFIDEITDLRDRFITAARKPTPPTLGVIVQLVGLRLATLESQLARPLPEGVVNKVKGRKPEPRRQGDRGMRARSLMPEPSRRQGSPMKLPKDFDPYTGGPLRRPPTPNPPPQDTN